MKRSIYSIVAIFLFSLLFIQCGKEEVEEESGVQLVENQLIAELNYENHAWGTQFYNVYLTADGGIYNFSYDVINQPIFNYNVPDDSGNIKLDMVTENINASVQDQNTIEQADIDKILIAINDITENLTEPEGSCFDAGIFRFSVYKYDIEKEEYQRVTLKECGDWTRISTDTKSQDLVEIILNYVINDTLSCCSE